MPAGTWPPKSSQLARAVEWAKTTKILMIGDSTFDVKAHVLGRLGVQTEACTTFINPKKYPGGLCTVRTNEQFMYSSHPSATRFPPGWPALVRYPLQSNNKFQLVIWNVGLHLLDRTPSISSATLPRLRFPDFLRRVSNLPRDLLHWLLPWLVDPVQHPRPPPTTTATTVSPLTAMPTKLDLRLAALKRNAAALQNKYPNAKHVYVLTNRMCSNGFDGVLGENVKTWHERSGRHGNASSLHDDRMQFSHVGTDNWNRAEQELSKDGWAIFDPAVSAADCACTPSKDGRHYLAVATSFWERMYATFGSSADRDG